MYFFIIIQGCSSDGHQEQNDPGGFGPQPTRVSLHGLVNSSAPIFLSLFH